jgi:hypothetical protein
MSATNKLKIWVFSFFIFMCFSKESIVLFLLFLLTFLSGCSGEIGGNPLISQGQIPTLENFTFYIDRLYVYHF